jgi:hypothetical protein
MPKRNLYCKVLYTHTDAHTDARTHTHTSAVDKVEEVHLSSYEEACAEALPLEVFASNSRLIGDKNM